MTRKERALEIASILNNLFPEPAIPLKHHDPYTLLISVLLSAQSTDARVNKVTPGLFSLAKTPEAMIQLDVELIEATIKPCGLAPAKSRAISDLSRILVENYESKVPATFEELEALPGVGHKTASVVMCQAFGQPAFPVDTHIHRLAWRWKLSPGKNVKKTESDLKLLYPEKMWAKLHLQMIYFGRQYCPARSHDPFKCPICSRFGRKSLFKKDS
jgi:endonuclease-3